MQTGEKADRAELSEIDTHHRVLEARALDLQKRLDKGVPQAQFKQLHSLSSAVKRAARALEEIRARLTGS